MPQTAHIFTSVPEKLLQLLTDQLPYSIAVLRRLQFTKFNGGISPTGKVVLISDTSSFDDDSPPPKRFTVAYVDVGGGRDTQMWLYSTLENERNANDAEAATVCEKQLTKLVDEIIKLGQDYGGQLTYPGSVLLGTLHSSVREILEKSGRVEPRATGNYDKWLFRVENIPNSETSLPEGMNWSTANEDDCRLVISRTDIPRTVESLSRMPSLMIKLEDGTPISWAFLGLDGSLASLHCEEPYRRRGLAKTLAAKIFRERTLDYGADGWCSADVSRENEASRAMCKRLCGVPYWVVSW
ncbi:Fc.00g114390.m01.CDS01 [Cosmosporella sp. VM-42]